MYDSLNDIYSKNNRPLSLKIEITNNCNLKCVHCYAREEKCIFLEKERIFQILLQAKSLGIVFLHFSGGECLTHPFFLEIYLYAFKLGFKISILTNGTLLTDDIIKILTNKKPYMVEISIYGTNEKISESVTGNRLAYKTTFKNIEKLKKNQINIFLKYILMDLNKDSLIPFLIYVKTNGINYKIYHNIMPTKNNDDWLNLQVSNFTKELLNYYMIENYPEMMLSEAPLSFKNCNAGKTYFNINCKGELYFCDFLSDISVKIINLGNAISNLQDHMSSCFEQLNINTCTNCYKVSVCDTCIASIANSDKKHDNCRNATYRYEIKKQLEDIRSI